MRIIEKIVALVCTDKGIVRNKQFNLSSNINVKEIVKTLSEVDITDEVIQIIHQKANRFLQIVKLISKP